MAPPHRISRALAFLVTVLALAAAPARAQEPAGAREEASGLPPGVSLSAFQIRHDEQDGSIVAEGAVTIEHSQGRIQADRIRFREGHIVEAEGNVLVVWENNRISGTRMVYDMGIENDPDPEKRIARGVIENAMGQVDPEFFFDARRVETIGEDRVVLHDATVTTCTQPVPHWSFRVSKAKIRLEGYAHLYNLRPKIKKVPFFYLPYLIWPVKRERAPGLLFPEFGTTSNRGQFVSLPVFFPMGESADLTVYPEYYTIAGWAGGAKLRMIPNRDGYAEAQAHFIADQVSAETRYRVLLKQTQSFLNGFRMVSDVDIVSDFDYYTDFVRNLTYASSPTTLGRLTFTRSGDWTSLLVQQQYREQLFVDGTTLKQSTFPKIDWRGRSRQLGKSPLYFQFASSYAMIQQDGERIHADYLRGDIGPTLSLPFSPAPWLDMTPSLAVRSTYWTQSQRQPANPNDPVVVLDEPLWRNLLGASLDLRGPKLYRIFETDAKPAEEGKEARPAKKYKNTIEPRLLYTYQQAFDRVDEVIIYDEVDRFGVDANAMTYGIASRLIAQRPRSDPEPQTGSGERILVPEGESGRLREAPTAVPDPDETAAADAGEEDAAPAPLEPVEIASLELSQTYSFNSTPSFADIDGDGVRESDSHFSSVGLTGRYNPSRTLSFNVTGRYDVLFDQVSEVGVSGNFRERMAQGLFSIVYRPGLGVTQTCGDVPLPADPDDCVLVVVTEKADATQLRFQGNFGPIAGRLRLGVDGTYNFTPSPTEKHLPYQRWRLEYYTQCCGFLAEYLINDYSAIQRREFRFAVDLRGIGKLFDFSQANQ